MINSRALTISGLFLLVFLLLIAKLFVIQIAQHEYYSLMAERQQNKPRLVKAERGTIRDINGEVLCRTQKDVSFYVDKRMMNQRKVDSVIAVFSRVCHKPKDYYRRLIEEGSNNICLEKKISMDTALVLKKTVIEGLFHQEDFTRVYPYGSLASHVIGFVNTQMKGMEGLEKNYENELTGKDGNYLFEQDVRGRTLSIDEEFSRAAIPGHSIVLTINKTFQQILEEELSNGLEKFGGEAAVGILMNPNTGEIVALANLPTFDPANYSLFSNEARRNRAITDTYEPGSTMKSIVMSVLIDQGKVNLNEIVNTENGNMIYKGKRYLDSHKLPSMTVKQVIEYSSDIGMIKLSERLNADVLYKYLRDFGFSNKTSIELPSESNGLLKKPSDFGPRTQASLSFGYEISVTPLQMITSYCALVNGGTLYQPFVVKKITDQLGNVIEETQPRKIRTILKTSTSELIKNFMVGVVENGTASAAQLENVLVGGKTGTSEMYESSSGSYSESKHNSSFIGFFPADKPNMVCLILVTSPVKAKYGGDVAAPIFRNVAKRLIETDMNLVPNQKKIERKRNYFDDLITDIKTSPKTKTTSFAHLAEKSSPNIPSRKIFNGSKTIMPNLINLPIRDAVAQLNEIGMTYKVVGTGKVVWQSVEPGSNLISGTVCNLKCERSIKKIVSGTN